MGPMSVPTERDRMGAVSRARSRPDETAHGVRDHNRPTQHLFRRGNQQARLFMSGLEERLLVSQIDFKSLHESLKIYKNSLKSSCGTFSGRAICDAHIGQW